MTLNFDELAERLAKHGIHMAPEQPTTEQKEAQQMAEQKRETEEYWKRKAAELEPTTCIHGVRNSWDWSARTMVRETWRPVEDGEYEAQHMGDSYIVEGECLTVQELIVGSGDTQVATIALPDDRRICRRVEMSDEANSDRYYRGFNDGVEHAQSQVERPRPNWSRAPDWAMWWAVDPNGHSYWYKDKPTLHETVDFAGWGQHVIQGEIQGNFRFCGEKEIPLGIDWRTLYEKRPEASDGQSD